MNEWYKRYISDKYYNQCTPIETAEAMVNTITADNFNANTKYLNMYCKDGVFLIALRNRLMKTRELIDMFPDPKDRRKHITRKTPSGGPDLDPVPPTPSDPIISVLDELRAKLKIRLK